MLLMLCSRRSQLPISETWVRFATFISNPQSIYTYIYVQKDTGNRVSSSIDKGPLNRAGRTTDICVLVDRLQLQLITSATCTVIMIMNYKLFFKQNRLRLMFLGRTRSRSRHRCGRSLPCHTQGPRRTACTGQSLEACNRRTCIWVRQR